jgi:methionyl-tRNA formyltransferase
MRIIFMGTPSFAVPTLEALHHKGHQIAAVFCQPDRPAGRGRGLVLSPVKQKALELGITVQQPETLTTLQTVQTVSNYNPEVLVVVAYGLKLPSDILNIPKYGAINLHPSLLPRYRGAAPINHALINGDQVTGISSILMNQRMDAGDIILLEEVKIGPEENAGELEQRLAGLGAELILRSLEVIKEGRSEFKKQDEALVTCAPKLSPEDGHIDWNKRSAEIQNRIRGVTPKPGAFAIYKGQRLEILKTNIEYRISNIEAIAGRIIAVEKNLGPVVKTVDGAVALLKIKPQGKKEMSGQEFLRGYRMAPGEQLL